MAAQKCRISVFFVFFQVLLFELSAIIEHLHSSFQVYSEGNLKLLQKFGLSTDFKPNKMDSVSKFSLFQKSPILKRRFWKIYIPLSLQFVVIICYTTVLYNKQSIVFGVLLLTWRKLDSTINTKKFANWQIFHA